MTEQARTTDIIDFDPTKEVTVKIANTFAESDSESESDSEIDEEYTYDDIKMKGGSVEIYYKMKYYDCKIKMLTMVDDLL